MKKNKILIIDTAIYYSSVINIPTFENMELNEALKICFGMMKRVIKSQDPDIVYFTKECKREDNWRIKYYDLYKCQRKDKTQKHQLFINKVIQMLKDHPKVNLVAEDNSEGDDLIHSIVKKYPYDDVIIYTRDKDMLQNLIYENVRVYIQELKTYTNSFGGTCNFNDDTMYDKEKFTKKFFFDVRYYNIYKAILGDNSDGYPGIAMVGKVAAEAICQALERHNIECSEYLDIFKILEFKEYESEVWYKRLKREFETTSNGIKAPNLYISFILAGFREVKISDNVLYYN